MRTPAHPCARIIRTLRQQIRSWSFGLENPYSTDKIRHYGSTASLMEIFKAMARVHVQTDIDVSTFIDASAVVLSTYMCVVL